MNFAGKFRFKRFHLQIHHHEAAQPQMIKKEVEKKFFAGHFQRVLPADEREADAKFHQEFLDVIEQAQLEVALPGAGVHREEVEDVRILQCLMCEIRLRRR